MVENSGKKKREREKENEIVIRSNRVQQLQQNVQVVHLFSLFFLHVISAQIVEKCGVEMDKNAMDKVLQCKRN